MYPPPYCCPVSYTHLADGKAVEFTKAEDGTLTAKVPENAEVTVKYTAPTDAIVFDLWSINSDAKLDVNVKENPLTFKMPAQAVTCLLYTSCHGGG